MKHGFREITAELKRESRKVDGGVRAARGIGLQLFELRRRQSDADQRVANARGALERIDVSALEAELAAALAEREAIASQLKDLEQATLAA